MYAETVFLGACPVIRPEGIYLDGRRVIALDPHAGLSGVGLGDVGDLIAYRDQWTPFVKAHVELWRRINELFESTPSAKDCPEGIFAADQVSSTNSSVRAFCASLALTRIRISDTDAGGIMTQWNAWRGKSSAEILQAASDILKWHQDVVMRVGGTYVEELRKFAEVWKIQLELPDLPPFSLQQEIRARIEGAFITAKGTIQIVGYGAAQTLVKVANVADALADGLADTARQLPKTISNTTLVLAVMAALVGGALLVYYVPRRPTALPPASP